jgi:hypothetical protein
MRGTQQTHRLMERFMKYTVEVGSGAMIYIPSFIKTDIDSMEIA